MEIPDFESNEMTNTPDDFYTPKTIAWELYQNNDDTPLSSQILGFGPNDGSTPNEYTFELLLSIFLEMLFHMIRMDLLENNANDTDDANDANDDPEIDLKYFDMELYYSTIRNKFKKISYLCTIETYDKNDDKDYLLEIVKNRYSRIILRSNPEDEHYFDEIDSVDDYDFIPCVGYKQQKNIKNIFSVMSIGSKMYKIKFDTILLPNKK